MTVQNSTAAGWQFLRWRYRSCPNVILGELCLTTWVEAELRICCVAQVLLGETFLALFVTCKEKCGMVKTIWNYVRSAID